MRDNFAEVDSFEATTTLPKQRTDPDKVCYTHSKDPVCVVVFEGASMQDNFESLIFGCRSRYIERIFNFVMACGCCFYRCCSKY